MAKTTLNPLTDTPKNLTRITQDFMLEYIKAKGTDEDKEWFKQMIEKNTVIKIDKKTNKEEKHLSNKDAKRAFAERFFPELVTKKKEKNNFFSAVENL